MDDFSSPPWRGNTNNYLSSTPTPKNKPYDGNVNTPSPYQSDDQSIDDSWFENNFIEMETLGQGHFGRVAWVKNKVDGMEYAMKIL